MRLAKIVHGLYFWSTSFDSLSFDGTASWPEAGRPVVSETGAFGMIVRAARLACQDATGERNWGSSSELPPPKTGK